MVKLPDSATIDTAGLSSVAVNLTLTLLLVMMTGSVQEYEIAEVNKPGARFEYVAPPLVE